MIFIHLFAQINRQYRFFQLRRAEKRLDRAEIKRNKIWKYIHTHV